MTIAFTGTSGSPTVKQVHELYLMLHRLKPSVMLHGGCIGADNVADRIAAANGIDRVVYPAISHKRVDESELRTRMGSLLTIRPAARPLDRNRTMVERADMVLACPRQAKEIVRSGTWMTVRYARKLGVPVIIIDP